MYIKLFYLVETLEAKSYIAIDYDCKDYLLKHRDQHFYFDW